ncbi:PTS system, mannose-specific IIB component [Enterococcus sp. AZ194]|uniref:PTS system mannose/fructose/N-acetylgalactosamine-transporter subunit IIB n=1 Tax=Enterococcus sp. AZ194 TaxID=2774629 RepID=UPI003F1ED2EF
MISMIRVDDRLIHGQVAVMWSKALEINRILVVSDEIAKNDIQISALMMAAPSGVKASVVPLEKGIKILNDPRSEKLRILVIVNDPKYVKGLTDSLTEKAVVNVANYGRIGGSLNHKSKLADSVYLTEQEKELFHGVIESGTEIIHQPLPSDARILLKDLLGGK